MPANLLFPWEKIYKCHNSIISGALTCSSCRSQREWDPWAGLQSSSTPHLTGSARCGGPLWSLSCPASEWSSCGRCSRAAHAESRSVARMPAIHTSKIFSENMAWQFVFFLLNQVFFVLAIWSWYSKTWPCLICLQNIISLNISLFHFVGKCVISNSHQEIS